MIFWCQFLSSFLTQYIIKVLACATVALAYFYIANNLHKEHFEALLAIAISEHH